MRGKYIQSTITTGRLTLPVAILISIACWVAAYFLIPTVGGENGAHAFGEMPIPFSIPVWIDKLACLLVYFVIGYLLIQINNTFALVRVRASVQTSFYLLLIAACPPLQQLCPGNIATLCMVVSIYLLFSTYQRMQSSGYVFHAFLFVGLSSLVFPQITLFTPILLIGAFSFHALNIRSFFAAIMGWSVPYWFLFGHAFYHDNMEMLYRPFIALATFCPIDLAMLTPWEIAMLGYTFVLFLVSAIHCLVQSYMDKIRTRIHLRFFIMLNVCIYIFIILQPMHCMNLLPLLCIGVSILTTHMFVLTSSKASNIFFIGALLGIVFLFFYNLWTLL